VLYSDRVRIENSKFSNTFLSAKSDDYASAGGSFIAKPRKGKELERSLAQLVRLDIPHALLTQSCVQASSDYRCAPPLLCLVFAHKRMSALSSQVMCRRAYIREEYPCSMGGFSMASTAVAR
jgi:hypothetical protein